MGKLIIICLDCGVDISDGTHRCCNRIYKYQLEALGATLVKPYGAYNGCIPTETWDYKGRKLIKTLSTCGDPDYTYLNDAITGQMVTLEDLKKDEE